MIIWKHTYTLRLRVLYLIFCLRCPIKHLFYGAWYHPFQCIQTLCATSVLFSLWQKVRSKMISCCKNTLDALPVFERPDERDCHRECELYNLSPLDKCFGMFGAFKITFFIVMFFLEFTNDRIFKFLLCKSNAH